MHWVTIKATDSYATWITRLGLQPLDYQRFGENRIFRVKSLIQPGIKQRISGLREVVTKVAQRRLAMYIITPP